MENKVFYEIQTNAPAEVIASRGHIGLYGKANEDIRALFRKVTKLFVLTKGGQEAIQEDIDWMRYGCNLEWFACESEQLNDFMCSDGNVFIDSDENKYNEYLNTAEKKEAVFIDFTEDFSDGLWDVTVENLPANAFIRYIRKNKPVGFRVTNAKKESDGSLTSVIKFKSPLGEPAEAYVDLEENRVDSFMEDLELLKDVYYDEAVENIEYILEDQPKWAVGLSEDDLINDAIEKNQIVLGIVETIKNLYAEYQLGYVRDVYEKNLHKFEATV